MDSQTPNLLVSFKKDIFNFFLALYASSFILSVGHYYWLPCLTDLQKSKMSVKVSNFAYDYYILHLGYYNSE